MSESGKRLIEAAKEARGAVRFRRPLYSAVSAHFPTEAEALAPPKLRVAVTCPDCMGACGIYVQLPGRPETAHLVECATCKGHGEVVEE